MQQTFQCNRCGAQNYVGQPYCWKCGATFTWQQTPPPVYQQPVNYQQQTPQFNLGLAQEQNTSGQGTQAIFPDEIKHWNWGAFFFIWIWGIGNNTWIALIGLIPYVNFVMAFILGAKGNEWAWRNKKWEGIEHFQKTQKAWAHWGFGLLFIPSLVFGLIGFIYWAYTQGYFK